MQIPQTLGAKMPIFPNKQLQALNAGKPAFNTLDPNPPLNHSNTNPISDHLIKESSYN